MMRSGSEDLHDSKGIFWGIWLVFLAVIIVPSITLPLLLFHLGWSPGAFQILVTAPVP